MRRVRPVLFWVARSRVASWFIGWSFAHMSWVIPVKRLHETETLMAFHHPKPSHPIHILIVPKRQRASLMALTDADADFMRDLFATAQILVRQLGLEATNYRLIVNGGAYQDVPQLHFHLVSD